MATLTDLQATRDKLVLRIASLQSRVSFGDRTVQYDLTQAQTALNTLDREIARLKVAEGGGASRVVRLNGRSGY